MIRCICTLIVHILNSTFMIQYVITEMQNFYESLYFSIMSKTSFPYDIFDMPCLSNIRLNQISKLLAIYLREMYASSVRCEFSTTRKPQNRKFLTQMNY